MNQLINERHLSKGLGLIKDSTKPKVMLEASARFYLNRNLRPEQREEAMRISRRSLLRDGDEWAIQVPRYLHLLSLPDQYIPKQFLEWAAKNVRLVSVKGLGVLDGVTEGVRFIGNVEVSHVGCDWHVVGPSFELVLAAINMVAEQKLPPGIYDSVAGPRDLLRENAALTEALAHARRQLTSIGLAEHTKRSVDELMRGWLKQSLEYLSMPFWRRWFWPKPKLLTKKGLDKVVNPRRPTELDDYSAEDDNFGELDTDVAVDADDR